MQTPVFYDQKQRCAAKFYGVSSTSHSLPGQDPVKKNPAQGCWLEIGVWEPGIMSKHVLVDGFNVIRRDAELSQVERINFYGAQSKLIKRLARYRRGTTHQITVVYDGGKSPNPFRQKSRQEGIQVVFSARGETADEVILDMISRDAARRSSYLVITADRDLASACRAQRVDVMSSEELLRRSRQAPQPAKPPDYWFGKREEQGWAGHTRKRGNPRRLPKNKRRTRSLW
ncbi:NYN domain-containing protein [candidate division FCPU426 bacterium]|nr:NYN domain-containing protein [candidate division FCPU426 bacterium]